MIRKTIYLLILIWGIFIIPVHASGFNLKSIGGVDTDGKLYSTWYHTQLQPTFAGEAQTSSEVDIKIDDQTYTAEADENGSWTWTPPEALSVGEHTVVLTNQESEISFSLVLGEENVNWDEVSETGEALPTVGIIEPTLILLTSGGILVALRKLLWA